MTITRADVADLRAGDVVRCVNPKWPNVHSEGPLHESDGLLMLGGSTLRASDGDPSYTASRWNLTVISRAPRPLYVNSDKTKPDPGDVVRDADSDGIWMAWYDGDGDWCNRRQNVIPRHQLPTRLRLLVDGRTGQVAP